MLAKTNSHHTRSCQQQRTLVRDPTALSQQ